MNQPLIPTVIIAGAGPGDADLITVKLQKQLALAEVIIVDRLVNPEIIDEYAAPNCSIVFAGKQGYNNASLSQQEINEQIIAHAQNGKKVLRLKGGDIAFYSNLMDELEALIFAKIPFQLIPGITAASGASAYAGIPLTARGYSKAVTFVTFNPHSYYPADKWRSIANSGDTVVFYMATKNIADLAEILLRFTRKPYTPIAVIEQATTAHQQVHISNIKNCAMHFAEKKFSSPSLIIMGDVVKLHTDFSWFDALEAGTVFKTLETVKL